jgi:hypothetical protein
LRQHGRHVEIFNDTGAAQLSFVTAPCSRRLLADPFSIGCAGGGLDTKDDKAPF